MEAVQTLINALVVAAVGLLLARITQNLRHEVKADVARLESQVHGLRDEMLGIRTDLRGEILGIRTDLRGEMLGIRTDLRGEIAELRAEMREMRSDLTRVALAVGAEPRAGRT